MDYAACYVVYVDRAACEDRLFAKDEEDLLLQTHLDGLHLQNGEDGPEFEKTPNQLLHENVATLLQTFGGGMRFLKPNVQLNWQSANSSQCTYVKQAELACKKLQNSLPDQREEITYLRWY